MPGLTKKQQGTRSKPNLGEEQPNNYQQPPAQVTTSQEQWATNYRLSAKAKLQAY